ncbi:MAG: arginase family protein, partial [Pyrinomonadaceae bacterium]
MKKVGILGVPLGFGAGKTGSELGVDAMRMSKVRGKSLSEHLRELGYDVTDHGDASIVRPVELSDAGNPKHLREMVASSENIIDSLTDILANDEFPVILGGDHAIAIPTFSAIANHYRQQNTEIGLI